MNCCYCGAKMNASNVCPSCHRDLYIWRRAYSISNRLYNDGLNRAEERDLSKAIELLKLSLRYNKTNTQARNLLGLLYYEMGEGIAAVSEWVISKSFDPDEDNRANVFLNRIQSNGNYIDVMGQASRKYNQALAYCHEDGCDLARIQLQQVLELSPNMVKAQQLLALLYLKEGRADLAKKILQKAETIDLYNETTRRLKKASRIHARDLGRTRAEAAEQGDHVVTYKRGNETIINPSKFFDRRPIVTVINLLIGAAIGIAVVCFLIVPEIRQDASSNATSRLVEANEDAATKEQTISDLEQQVSDMQKQVEDAQTKVSEAEETTTSYQQLLTAYTLYNDGEMTDAGDSLAQVNEDQLNDEGKELYDSIASQIKASRYSSDMSEAYQDYAAGNYTDAIPLFKEIADESPDYSDGNAAYLLAFCYMYTGDNDNALKYFQLAEENGSSSIAKVSKNMITALQTGTATTTTGSSSTSGTGTSTDESSTTGSSTTGSSTTGSSTTDSTTD